MSLPVHWVASLAGVRPGHPIEVTGDEAHHAVAVRRLRAGEQVVLTDGTGRTATGRVVTTGKRLLTVEVDEVRTPPRPDPAVTVVQALPKGDRGELAVEMLTEVGVETIVPWAAARSVAVWRGERAAKSLARWRGTAREAAKQARRAWFPEVTGLMTTAGVAALLADGALSVVLHEEAATPLASLEVPPTGSIVVVVGPEGGLTDDEVAASRRPGPARSGWVSRCCAPRPPESPPSRPCCRAPRAGADPLLHLDRAGVDLGMTLSRRVVVLGDEGVLPGRHLAQVEGHGPGVEPVPPMPPIVGVDEVLLAVALEVDRPTCLRRRC